MHLDALVNALLLIPYAEAMRLGYFNICSLPYFACSLFHLVSAHINASYFHLNVLMKEPFTP